MTTRLEQIKTRLDAATPGPWRSEGNGVSAPNSFVQGLYKVGQHASGRWGAKIPEPDAICVTCDEEYIENRNPGDVDLIAHAPDDLAALLRIAEAAERWDEADVKLDAAEKAVPPGIGKVSEDILHNYRTALDEYERTKCDLLASVRAFREGWERDDLHTLQRQRFR